MAVTVSIKDMKRPPIRAIIHRYIILWVIFLLLSVSIVMLSQNIISQNHRYVIQYTSEIIDILEDEQKTAIVFGSAVDPDGDPRGILRQRLDTAAMLYNDKLIDMFVLSGYQNIPEEYDEPTAMKRYMIEKHNIDAEQLLLDTQGDNTFETCKIAAKNGLAQKTALLITQPSHIDRALFLCRHHGITAFGYTASADTSRTNAAYQRVRESLSNVKALLQTVVE